MEPIVASRRLSADPVAQITTDPAYFRTKVTTDALRRAILELSTVGTKPHRKSWSATLAAW
ncbi:hypothetical protein L0F63_002781, partial [Massospora cicadina]